MKTISLFKPILGFIYETTVLAIARKVNTRVSRNIPQYVIRDIHIRNTKLITNREDLLRLLPQNGVVAELGVDEGDFSQSILTLNKPKKLHLVDFWGSKRYNQEKKRQVESRFKENIQNGEVEINIGLSTNVVEGFQNEYFDWIYIDTCHSYKTTIEELELYREKVKGSGIIAGHDYILGNWNGIIRYGVIEAVYEFCIKYNWEILYLTMELHTNPSFAIRKIVDVVQILK